MKIFGIILIIVVLIGGGVYFFTKGSEGLDAINDRGGMDIVDPLTDITDDSINDDDMVSDEEPKDDTQTMIGKSVEGRDIMAYHYGSGDTELLFVGGIHGGYSWNTVLVAEELRTFLEENPDVVPNNLRVTVVPKLNPDGLYEVVGMENAFTKADVPASRDERVPGRFNANDVDLNRNFDCDWEATATWQSREVSGGDAVFSEPESKAIRDYVMKNDPSAVVVWYSAAGGVFASSCHNGVLDETRTITKTYADASGYKAYEEFDFYDITGDMVNWLAKEKVPAVSVLLSTHEDIEWQKNKEGIMALFEYYSQE